MELPARGQSRSQTRSMARGFRAIHTHVALTVKAPSGDVGSSPAMGAMEIRSVTRRFSRLVQRGNAGQANMVPYLKRQRSRLITGHILVRGQGEPPDLQSRLSIGMIAATIQRPAKQLRLRCGLGERRSGSLLEFQPLFSCNLLGGYALCTIPVISSGGGQIT